MGEFLKRIRGCSRNQILILVLTGILLVIIGLPVQEKEEKKEAAELEYQPELTAEEQLEQRLEQILSQVSGIGKTRVMVSLKSNGRKIVEKDMEYSEGKEENVQAENSSANLQTNQAENTVYEKDQQGNERPYVTEELLPEIEGVLVIAQGAGNAQIVTEITEAVMALFGVDAHKIKVMKMN